ncbi:dTDP-glucose 4,6-dehydratase [Candidatus Kaiserbacteria bacterium]|nr:dTDP-glucose 4,6-dehydratase [Candidatus Kaiserbacteria bacterium]
MYDKIILVTGGAGFIGSHYLNMMVPRYPHYRFVNVDLLTYAANPANISVADAPNYLFVKADICDRDAMAQLFQQHAPTHVLHFAAESHVDNSIERPQAFIETNIVGTQILLDLARVYGVQRFHQVSTDEVYGSIAEWVPPVSEEAPLLPNSPYSASKASGDLLVRAYHKTFGLNTVLTRASNNYGPHQHTEKLIPRFITTLLSGKNVPLYGDGRNVRDWIYVGDHVEGIDHVFHKGKAGEIYNLGGNNEMSNVEITNVLLRMGGYGEDRIERVADRLGHDFRYSIDSSKAKKELGWQPKMDFTKGLQTTWEYYVSVTR